MEADLQAIADAWENRPAAGEASSGPDGEEAAAQDADVYELADAYVAAHPDDFAGFAALPLEALVKTIDTYRTDGRDEDAMKVQVWLWHHFEPQKIGGTYEATLRVPNGN